MRGWALALLLGCSPPTTDFDSTPSARHPSSELITEPLPGCEVPQTPGFEDAPDSGVLFVHRLDPADLDDASRAFTHAIGGGVLASDLDGDGHVDLFFTQASGPCELWWGLGDGRFDRSVGSGAEWDGPFFGAWAPDLDADGLRELVLTGRDRVILLHQPSAREFTDQTASSGLGNFDGDSAAVAVGDWDGDSILDLYVGGYVKGVAPGEEFDPIDSPDRWLHGTDPDELGFEQATPLQTKLPGIDPDSDGACLFATWSDLDRDGDSDLLQWNDFGGMTRPTLLWENGGADGHGAWLWTDRAADAGLGVPQSPMGAAVTDLDGDLLTDLWASDIGPTRVWRGQGGFDFTDVGLAWAAEVPATPGQPTWSVVPLDLAGDGGRAVYISAGPLPAIHGQSPVGPEGYRDRLVVRGLDPHGGVEFLPAEGALAEVEANSRGVALADLNEDGVPDLVVGRLGGPPRILLGRCTEHQRLVVQLHDPSGHNRDAIGAWVRVEAGGLVQEQEARGEGPGTFGGSEAALFFGVGAAERLDVLEVTWPDGVVERWADLPSGRRIQVRRGPV